MELRNFPVFTADDLKMRIPCGAMVSGATQSGKTTFLLRLIKHAREMFLPPPRSIMYAHGTMSKDLLLFLQAGCILHKGLPSEAVIDRLPKPAMIILDDLMVDAKSGYLQDLFTRQVHHKNLALFFVTQYLFDPHARVARNNSQYLFFMRAPTDQLSIRNIGYQWFPMNKQYFKSAYKQATERPYGYLMANMHPAAPDALRLLSCIFPGEQVEIYLPID